MRSALVLGLVAMGLAVTSAAVAGGILGKGTGIDRVGESGRRLSDTVRKGGETVSEAAKKGERQVSKAAKEGERQVSKAAKEGERKVVAAAKKEERKVVESIKDIFMPNDKLTLPFRIGGPTEFDGRFYAHQLLQRGLITEKQLEGFDFTRHYQKSGIAGGLPPNMFFDPDYYLLANPDVAELGLDGKAALAHWIERGVVEGRRGSEFFDVKHYIRSNPGFQDRFGSDYPAAYVHFSTTGYRMNLETAPGYAFITHDYGTILPAHMLPHRRIFSDPHCLTGICIRKSVLSDWRPGQPLDPKMVEDVKNFLLRAGFTVAFAAPCNVFTIGRALLFCQTLLGEIGSEVYDRVDWRQLYDEWLQSHGFIRTQDASSRRRQDQGRDGNIGGNSRPGAKPGANRGTGPGCPHDNQPANSHDFGVCP